MRTAKVKCPKCQKEMGYQGLSRHMAFKHGQKGKLPNMRNSQTVVPGEHPVEDLERTISRLVQRETELSERLNEMQEIRTEIEGISALRTSLEELVLTYKRRKEELTATHM